MGVKKCIVTKIPLPWRCSTTRQLLICQYGIKVGLNPALQEQESLQNSLMKKILLLTVSILYIIGCQKNDFINQVSFKMNGELIICNESISSNESDNWGYSILDLYGEFDYNSDNFHPEYIQITLDPFDENKREYPIGPSDETCIKIHLNKNGSNNYFAHASGVIIIEELSPSHIKGTFECIAQPDYAGGIGPLTITEGKFNMSRDE